MFIGILSDSHGKTQRLAQAMALLADRGAKTLVHCGDISSARDVEQLAKWEGEVYLVAGNMDRPHINEIEQAANANGIHFSRSFITVPLEDDAYLAATHGDQSTLLKEWLDLERFEYICYGHTHQLLDEVVGTTRVLNPGALNNPRGPLYHSAILLDTQTDTAEEIEVD